MRQGTLFRIFTGEIYPVDKTMVSSVNYTYTGHETFACRSYWLKKGYDFLETENNFSSPEATSILGVGKNMVRSIRFWLRAFELVENNKLSSIAKKIFDSDNGWDPYLEDVNTIWLLHYLLVKNGYAKVYSDFFNDYRKKQVEFSFENLERYIRIQQPEIADKTLKSDINVLKNNYIRPNRKINSIEDSFSVFLQELNLIDQVSSGVYFFNMRKKHSLDNKIVFYSILDKAYDSSSFSLSFDNLMYERNSPGSIFCLTQEELYTRIQNISSDIDGIVFTEDAGIRELQISNKMNLESVLESYYEER